MKFLFFLLISMFYPVWGAFAEINISSRPPGERWSITTRMDYSVRINGEYIGYANEEIREVYRLIHKQNGGWLIYGDARILGDTKHNGIPVAAKLEQILSTSFQMFPGGAILAKPNSFPRLQGFPTFPNEAMHEGHRWEAPVGILLRAPDGSNYNTNQIAEYHYRTRKPYREQDADYFDVQWAVRDATLGLQGTHNVSLIVDAESGTPLMARDRFTERWDMPSGSVEERKGFALIFWNGIPPLDIQKVEKRFAEAPIADRGTGLTVTETSSGVSVMLHNLHFEPNNSVILQKDIPLLDELATIIAAIPKRTIIVRGHTADLGRPQEQYKLSDKRAKRVADALVERGIDPHRVIYEGVGADEPLESNNTEKGRKLNRRVELIVLED